MAVYTPWMALVRNRRCLSALLKIGSWGVSRVLAVGLIPRGR